MHRIGNLQNSLLYLSKRTREPQLLFARAPQLHRSTSAMEVCSPSSIVSADTDFHEAPDDNAGNKHRS